MKNIKFLFILAFLVSCAEDTPNEKTTQQSSTNEIKATNAKSAKTADVIAFENAFIEFNDNVSKYGQEKAEEMIKQEAILYLQTNELEFDEDEIAGKLVIKALEDMNQKVKQSLKQ